jgi:hypothetical protein
MASHSPRLNRWFSPGSIELIASFACRIRRPRVEVQYGIDMRHQRHREGLRYGESDGPNVLEGSRFH